MILQETFSNLHRRTCKRFQRGASGECPLPPREVITKPEADEKPDKLSSKCAVKGAATLVVIETRWETLGKTD